MSIAKLWGFRLVLKQWQHLVNRHIAHHRKHSLMSLQQRLVEGDEIVS